MSECVPRTEMPPLASRLCIHGKVPAARFEQATKPFHEDLMQLACANRQCQQAAETLSDPRTDAAPLGNSDALPLTAMGGLVLPAMKNYNQQLIESVCHLEAV